MEILLIVNFSPKCIMAYEHLSDAYLQELESMSTTPMTQEEIQFLEVKQSLNDIQNSLQELNTSLCILVSKVCNIVTILNSIQDRIVLKE